jgi:predicted lipoprotein with Yx(FWY)xxD motif
MRRFVALAAVAIVAAAAVIVLFAAGGGSKQTASASHRSPAPRTSASVALRKTSLGSILVDSRGRTLYLFEADKAGMSACSGSCAAVWPPLMATGTPHGGPQVKASELGTIAGSAGGRQVSYHGHPLYTFAGDAKAGDTTGQGLDQFGAEWYVVNAHGDKIDND